MGTMENKISIYAFSRYAAFTRAPLPRKECVLSFQLGWIDVPINWCWRWSLACYLPREGSSWIAGTDLELCQLLWTKATCRNPVPQSEKHNTITCTGIPRSLKHNTITCTGIPRSLKHFDAMNTTFQCENMKVRDHIEDIGVDTR
jgi:hypothetical protein